MLTQVTGEIFDYHERFIPSLVESIMDASSQLGIAGRMLINATDVDISRELTVLSDNYLDIAELIQHGCNNDEAAIGMFW
ncbi:MAG: hypothetical protein R3E08_14165 [Thiotrichaceae bacterium]